MESKHFDEVLYCQLNGLKSFYLTFTLMMSFPMKMKASQPNHPDQRIKLYQKHPFKLQINSIIYGTFAQYYYYITLYIYKHFNKSILLTLVNVIEDKEEEEDEEEGKNDKTFSLNYLTIKWEMS